LLGGTVGEGSIVAQELLAGARSAAGRRFAYSINKGLFVQSLGEWISKLNRDVAVKVLPP
jgi:hypothetical protein